MKRRTLLHSVAAFALARPAIAANQARILRFVPQGRVGILHNLHNGSWICRVGQSGYYIPRPTRSPDKRLA